MARRARDVKIPQTMGRNAVNVRKLSDRNERICKLWEEQGITINNLSERFNVSRKTVGGILKAYRDKKVSPSVGGKYR